VRSTVGSGELGGWVRVAAVRCLINMLERDTRSELIEDDALELLAGSHIAADDLLSKEESKVAFKQAFAEAFDQLTNREKGLLRYAYADGLTVDRIGAIYRVHRATAARWITVARDKLVAGVIEGLVDRLDIESAQVPSVLRSALSTIPSTVMRHLRGT
jgi:RNA polymerase sigma-70 factor (ECF subfamily)